MKALIEYLRGKKTIGTAAVAILYLAGCFLGWFNFDEKVLEVLGFSGLAFLRSAISSHSAQVGALLRVLDSPKPTLAPATSTPTIFKGP